MDESQTKHISEVIEQSSQLPGPADPARLASPMTAAEFPAVVTPLRLAAYRAEISNQPMPQLCPNCGGTGYVKIKDALPDDPEFGKIEHCQVCNVERRQRWLADNCGLEPTEMDKAYSSQYRQGDWSGVEPKLAKVYCEQRIAASKVLQEIRQQRIGLVSFWGDYGAGKTFALQIAVNEARVDMVESFYAPFVLILQHLRGLVAQKQDNSGFLTRLFDIPVLAVDEVTRFNDTGWAMEQLFALVDTRYRRRKSHLTLFATNDDPTQVLDTGESVGYLFSRMRKGSLFELRGDMR